MTDKKNENSAKNSEKKETVESFKQKFLSLISRTVKVSRKGLKSAGQAISDFGDKSVLKIENTQIRSRIEKKYIELGTYVYVALTSKKSVDVSLKNSDIKNLVSEIDKYFSQVSENEVSIKAVDQKREKNASSSTAKKAPAKPESGTVSVKKPASKTSAAKKAGTAAKKPALKNAVHAAGKPSVKAGSGAASVKKPAVRTAAAKTAASKTSAAKKAGSGKKA